MSNANYLNWSSEDVSNWLGCLSLHHLVPNFEKLQIDGSKLAALSDQDLRGKLRLTKPAEVMAIRGAVIKLLDDASRPSAARRVSASPRVGLSTGPRDRASSFENRPAVISRDFHRNTIASEQVVIKQPRLVQGSAPALIDKECKYSGWIRKQGGGYKNWKKRYLVLRLGCLYYFPNETASAPKGSFVLSGYKTEVCTEPDIVRKYKYTLKLIPSNSRVRTYYISVGSERELLGWKEAVDDEIRSVTSRRISLEQRQNSSDSTTLSVMGQGMAYPNDDDDDDDDEDDNPYDIPEGFERDDDSEHNYDDPASIMAGNREDDSDEDDPYSEIREISTLGKPTVPNRPAFSLPVIATSTSSLQSPPATTDGINEDTYLSIVAGGPALDPAAAQPDLGRTSSPPVSSTTPLSASVPSSVPQIGHDSDYEDNAPESGEEEDDDGGYYIMFRKPEELMPPSCIFDRLERSEADRLLKEKDRDGTYLIRGGSHAGADKVLSVWHINRCRHYKLFKDDTSYSLTQGQSFRTIPELLQHYTLQSHLPRSDFYLGDPFNPADH